MLKKREGITKEQALENTCKKNGLVYNAEKKNPIDKIIIEDENGNKQEFDKELNCSK